MELHNINAPAYSDEKDAEDCLTFRIDAGMKIL